jgi:hypothetical protein
VSDDTNTDVTIDIAEEVDVTIQTKDNKEIQGIAFGT